MKPIAVAPVLAVVLVLTVVACDAPQAVAPRMTAQLAKGGVQVQKTDLAAPDGITATINGNTLTVSWNAVSDALEYQVVFEPPAGAAGIAAGAPPHTTSTSLTRDVSGLSLEGYCVKVRAIADPGSAFQSSGWSACVPITVQSCVNVSWDIKPGNGTELDPIEVFQGNNAEIPVAIFGSGSFDVSKVEISSITLGDGQGTETPVDTKQGGGLFYSIENVLDNEGTMDTYPDLSLKFSRATMLANGDLPTTAQVWTLNLHGTYNGMAFCPASQQVQILVSQGKSN